MVARLLYHYRSCRIPTQLQVLSNFDFTQHLAQHLVFCGNGCRRKIGLGFCSCLSMFLKAKIACAFFMLSLLAFCSLSLSSSLVAINIICQEDMTAATPSLCCVHYFYTMFSFIYYEYCFSRPAYYTVAFMTTACKDLQFLKIQDQSVNII